MIVTLAALESDSDRSHGALRNHFEEHNECGGCKKKVGRPVRSRKLLYAAGVMILMGDVLDKGKSNSTTCAKCLNILNEAYSLPIA